MAAGYRRQVSACIQDQPAAYGSLPGSAKAANACGHVGWTDDRVADLRRLWADGLSASQIAKKLGGVTRNSVIGKANRLGLEGRARPSAPTRVRKAYVPVVKRPNPKGVMVLNPVKGGDLATANRIENMAAREQPAENVLQMARAFAPLPGREPVPFGSKGCKWPIDTDGPEALQCGNACSEGERGAHPYCAAHCAVAWQKPKPGVARTGNELMRQLRRYA